MNHYAPKQLTSGGYHYTLTTDSDIRPIGYCNYDGYKNPDNPSKMIDNPHKYHQAPHPSEEEAIDCFKDYLIDHTNLNKMYLGEDETCEICDKITRNLLMLTHAPYDFVLCDEHFNKQSLQKILVIKEKIT